MGVSVGAMLGEQQTLVPFWKTMQPEAFHLWYVENGPRLTSFFSPLQISCVVLAIAAVTVSKIQQHPGTLWLGISLTFSAGVLVTFFLFFKEVNAGFAAQPIPAAELSDLLERWTAWQWARIGLGAFAFCSVLYGLCAIRVNAHRP